MPVRGLAAFLFSWALSGCAAPLASAIRAGDSAQVEAAINAGANPSSYSVPSGTQLSTVALAITTNNVDVLRTLVNHDAEMWYLNPPPLITVVTTLTVAPNAFTVAKERSLVPLADVLLSKAKSQGREVEFANLADEDGNTALHFAAMMGANNLTTYLLQHGANPNAVNLAKDTPLHFSAAKGNDSTYRILVSAGGIPSALNRDGMSPAKYLAEFHRKQSEPSFQWGKLAVMAASTVAISAAGGGLDAETQADLFSAAVMDSMPGQSGVENYQTAGKQSMARIEEKGREARALKSQEQSAEGAYSIQSEVKSPAGNPQSGSGFVSAFPAPSNVPLPSGSSVSGEAIYAQRDIAKEKLENLKDAERKAQIKNGTYLGSSSSAGRGSVSCISYGGTTTKPWVGGDVNVEFTVTLEGCNTDSVMVVIESQIADGPWRNETVKHMRGTLVVKTSRGIVKSDVERGFNWRWCVKADGDYSECTNWQTTAGL